MAVHKTHSFYLQISIYFVIPIVKLLLRGRIWNEDTSNTSLCRILVDMKEKVNRF